MDGFPHVRARARRSRMPEPFPARTIGKRFLDRLMYAVGFCMPFALVPQILELHRTKSAAGVSLATWSFFTMGNFLWALYGSIHKDRQLFFANALVLLFDFVIIGQLLFY